jgi:hypothetical protein
VGLLLPQFKKLISSPGVKRFVSHLPPRRIAAVFESLDS